MQQTPKIAIVCDYLTIMGGAENVVLEISKIFPDAPIFTAVYLKDNVPKFQKLDVRPSMLQTAAELLGSYYKLLPHLASKAMEKLDLHEFDVIITSSYLHANHIRKSRPEQLLISYCHTPARYYWSHYREYRKDPGYGMLNPFVKAMIPLMVPKQRKRDLESSKQVDVYIANSSETQARIKKYYQQPSTILHPPVDIKRFTPSPTRAEFYVALGRQLPNKRFDLAVQACTELNLPLKVIGDGPNNKKLQKLAGANIEFLRDRKTNASNEAVIELLNHAKAMIFPSDEDFGIVAVEALAAGAPVIAYGKSGVKDIVEQGVSGVLFDKLDKDSVITAIEQFLTLNFPPDALARKAKRFDASMFENKFKRIVSHAILTHKSKLKLLAD